MVVFFKEKLQKNKELFILGFNRNFKWLNLFFNLVANIQKQNHTLQLWP